jgi:hypothetical protein
VPILLGFLGAFVNGDAAPFVAWPRFVASAGETGQNVRVRGHHFLVLFLGKGVSLLLLHAVVALPLLDDVVIDKILNVFGLVFQPKDIQLRL